MAEESEAEYARYTQIEEEFEDLHERPKAPASHPGGREGSSMPYGPRHNVYQAAMEVLTGHPGLQRWEPDVLATAIANTVEQKTTADLCLCKHPRPGPLYWDFRCTTCSGTIIGWWRRRKLRRERDAVATPSPQPLSDRPGGRPRQP